MQQLCDLLPKEVDGAELPIIYDTRFSEELLGRTKNVAANRYGEGGAPYHSADVFDKREGADTFHAVLALVPDEVKGAGSRASQAEILGMGRSVF